MAKTLQYSVPNEENIVRVVLDNGITVLVYENFSAQSVVLAGSFDAGSVWDIPEKSGLAALVANSLIRGTETRDFDTLHRTMEDLAADLNFGASKHNTSFSGKALAEDFGMLADLLADTLRHPVFPADHVERLRGEWLTGLRYRQQDSGWLASRAFRQMLYPVEHPYHHSSQGTLDSIPQLSLDDMRAFHSRHYGPKDMKIVVVGALKATDAVQILREHLGDWINVDQPESSDLPELTTLGEPKRGNIVVQGKKQTNLMLGAVGPSRYEPEFRAASLANSILGQFGMMGRIGDVVREREGLAYYAGSQITGGQGPGAWSINAGVDPTHVERAIDLCLGEVRRITSEPVSDDDIADNKSYFIGRLPLQLENNEGIAASLLTIETYQLGLNYLLSYRDIIQAITKDELLHAAQKYLNADAMVISVAGPGEHG
ncbi:MAG: pitrilysin family protein [Aggregatilineales bacterium]